MLDALPLRLGEELHSEREALEHAAEVNNFRQLLEIAEQERDEAKQSVILYSSRIAKLASKSGLSPEQRNSIKCGIRSNVSTILDALHIVEALFPERVVILPAAWGSANEAASFQKADKALELMLVLLDEYWTAIQDGGDAAARNVFSTATYAARESETVERNKSARARRTFHYNGTTLTMWKHLKIGVKDSVAETWRLHFEFDAQNAKIVIGHCGKHLDFK